MTGYVIIRNTDRKFVRNTDRKFVSRPGSTHSYTCVLEDARVYATEQQARADCCGNETVRSIASLLPVTRGAP